MMTSTQTLRILALTAVLIPAFAQADYLEPEDVLNSNQNVQYYNPPPSPRTTEATQAQQQSSDAARRAAEQRVLFAKSSSSAEVVLQSSSSAPSDQSALLQQLVNQLSQGHASSFSNTDQRILDRVKQQQMDTEIQLQAAQIVASQQSLHSGAPLTSSGPGTYIAALILGLAGVVTIWQAKRMERKV